MSLEDCHKEEQLGYRLPGTTALLAARAMAQVLLTIENLATEGVVTTAITWRSFCLRPGLRSGFLRRVSFCERDAHGIAGHYPYYERSQPQELRASSGYLAVLVSFLRLAVPDEFCALMADVSEELFTPLAFLQALLGRKWN